MLAGEGRKIIDIQRAPRFGAFRFKTHVIGTLGRNNNAQSPGGIGGLQQHRLSVFIDIIIHGRGVVHFVCILPVDGKSAP